MSKSCILFSEFFHLQQKLPAIYQNVCPFFGPIFPCSYVCPVTEWNSSGISEG